MPHTVNGIGTWYYGKKNLTTRRGTCQFCGREAEIRDYETRLWFVVLFIPVIPLARKQILDECRLCTRHRAVPIGEWERVTQEAVQEAGEAAAKDPNDPDAATELHATLTGFQKRDEAKQLADLMATRFADSAKVQLYLGGWHEHEGRGAEADACFARAFELEPDNAAAKRAVGIGCIERGDLVRARELLAPQIQPGEGQEPVIIRMMADAHAAKGEHEEALLFYQAAIKAVPQIAKDKTLRKRIQASEQAAGRAETLLPRQPFPLRWVVIPAAIAVVLLGAWLVNHYKATHQTLHVINHTGLGATIAIDGSERCTVDAGRKTTIPIAEGSHSAQIKKADGSESTVPFKIRNTLKQRYGKDSLFILNVDAAADLLWEKIIYVAPGEEGQEGSREVHYAKPFLTFRSIDFPMQKFPDETQIERRREARTGVQVLDWPAIGVLNVFLKDKPPEERLTYVEHHLGVNPANGTLAQQYFLYATALGEMARARGFLAKGLDRRPVAIEWHRMYQEACKSLEPLDAIRARYDKMLAAEPESSALLYLRGRLELKREVSKPYFDRAIAADAENAYPWYARAHNQMARGDFAAARKSCAEACRLAPKQSSMADMLFDLRVALGELSALERELRAELTQKPLLIETQKRLLRVLIASGRQDEARKAQRTYEQQVKQKTDGDPYEIAPRTAMTLHYALGDLEAYEAAGRALETDTPRAGLDLILHLERGDLAAAAKILDEHSDHQNALSCLLLSLGYEAKGDRAKADHWRGRVVEKLAEGRPAEKLIAGLLGKGDALDLADVGDIAPARQFRAAVLVALAARCPRHRAELLGLAERFNPVDDFPHHFLRRTIDAMKEK